MNCPHCNLYLPDRPDLAGQWFSCPNCTGPFQMPAPVMHYYPAAVQQVDAPPAAADSHAIHSLRTPHTTIRVAVPRQQSNSLGIGSLMLGIIGLFLFFLPVIGAALSGLGALLGLFGLFAALGRRGSGLGFAIAGLAICAAGLVIQWGVIELIRRLSESVANP